MRSGFRSLLLWSLAVGVLTALVLRVGPWLWPRLFPGPVEPVAAAQDEAPSSEYVAEVLSRFLAGWGEHLPPDGQPLVLPQGKHPKDLQAGLRIEPRLAGLEIYVTARDDLDSRLRVFSGPTLLLVRDVRPWLPDVPVVSQSRPPPLGVVVHLPEDAAVGRQIGQWRTPLSLALPAFAPHTAKAARQAAWDGKGVVIALAADEPLIEQSRAVPEASAVLLDFEVPDETGPWLSSLASLDLVLLDARPEAGDGLAERAKEAGVVVLRVGDLSDRSLSWNLAVRRGYGVVLATVAERDALEGFVEASRDAGFDLARLEDVARRLKAGSAPPAAP